MNASSAEGSSAERSSAERSRGECSADTHSTASPSTSSAASSPGRPPSSSCCAMGWRLPDRLGYCCTLCLYSTTIVLVHLIYAHLPVLYFQHHSQCSASRPSVRRNPIYLRIRNSLRTRDSLLSPSCVYRRSPRCVYRVTPLCVSRASPLCVYRLSPLCAERPSTHTSPPSRGRTCPRPRRCRPGSAAAPR